MPVATIGSAEALPPSHCYISIARGRTIRTLRIRAGTIWGGIGAAALITCWLVGSGLYLVFHDDLVAALIAREAAAQYAYEDRIASLRGQVEREASQKLVGQTTLDVKLRDLAARAATLEARASLLAQINAHTALAAADRGDATQAPLIAPAPGAVIDNPVDGEPTGTTRSGVPPVAAKPHPEIEGRAMLPSGAAGDGASFALRLAGVEERLERIDAGQYRNLAVAVGAARTRAAMIRTAIESAGLSPDRVVAKRAAQDVGGPFVPLDPAIGASSFGKALEGMQTDLAAASGLVAAMPRLPFGRPLSGALEVTSPFGARLDPFLGRPAMHTGVDFAEGYGTDVRATAAGRVVTAGPTGGYGNMVEIDHGHGLATRYGHLSAIGVSVGQSVEKGTVIGEVGATGRATGPHLHYETRIDGEAVDPLRFLNAGARLAALDQGQ